MDTPNELGTITITCDDGDSWPGILSLSDYLVEIELRDRGELRSGYSEVQSDGIALRTTFHRADGKLVKWDSIRSIRVL